LENQKGYHYLDLSSNRLIISHHVSFDESSFPFAEKSDPILSSNFDFLLEFNVIPSPIRSYFHLVFLHAQVPLALAPLWWLPLLAPAHACLKRSGQWVPLLAPVCTYPKRSGRWLPLTP
jgi:hypothetical protein